VSGEAEELRKQLAEKDEQIARQEVQCRKLLTALETLLGIAKTWEREIASILEDADHPARAATMAKVKRADSLAQQARALRALGRSIPEIAEALDRSHRQVSRYFPRDTSSESH